MSEISESRKTDGRRVKVLRLIEEYDLEGIGDELEQRWTADNRDSLRDLAAYFNKELLFKRLREVGERPLDGEVSNMYRLLTDRDVSEAEQTRMERRLERNGLDVATLQTDFVSYQAIRTFLKDHRGVEHSPDETDPIEREKSNLQKLRGRSVSVTNDKLDILADSDEIQLGTYRTVIDIRVMCEDCNSQFDVLELLDNGGCGCGE